MGDQDPYHRTWSQRLGRGRSICQDKKPPIPAQVFSAVVRVPNSVITFPSRHPRLCGSKFAVIDQPEADTAFYLAAAKAFNTARHDFQGEKRRYNIAVFPAPSDQLYVYVVPAQTKTEVVPLGGDVRYLMTANGESVLEKRQLHKSIIEVDPKSIPKGASNVAGRHTHVLSDVPEDTDVFHVLTRQPPRPEIIFTRNKKMYEISVDGTIRERKM
jgi:hypothetical protein